MLVLDLNIYWGKPSFLASTSASSTVHGSGVLQHKTGEKSNSGSYNHVLSCIAHECEIYDVPVEDILHHPGLVEGCTVLLLMIVMTSAEDVQPLATRTQMHSLRTFRRLTSDEKVQGCINSIISSPDHKDTAIGFVAGKSVSSRAVHHF